MWKKDRKICSPFSLDDNNLDIKEQLPPLYVAKFRWWRCQNCIKEIGVASTSEDIRVLSKCCINGFTTCSSCAHFHSQDNEATVPSDLQQTSNLNNLEERKADVNISANVKGDEYHLTSVDYKNEKNAVTEHQAISGHGNDSKYEENPENVNLTFDMTKFNSVSVEEREVDESVASKSKIHGLIDTSQSNVEIYNAASIAPAIESFNCPGSSSAEFCLAERVNSADDEERNVSKACEAPCLSGNVDKAINTIGMPATRLSSLELKGNDDESSESEDITRNSTNRRTRKVRLLIELLSGKENAGNDLKKTETAAPDAMPDLSVGNDSHAEMALNENTEKSFRSPQRKRKMPQVEESKPLEKSCINNLAKNVGAVERDRENPIPTIDISDSDQEGNADASIGLQIGIRRQRSKDGIDRSAKLTKRKTKQSQAADGSYFLAPRREVSNVDFDKYCAAATCSKARYDAFTDRSTGSYFKSYMHPQQTERKSSLWKKKSKIPQFEGQTSLLPPTNCVPGEESTKRMDVEAMHFYSGTTNHQPRHDALPKMGLDLSLNSFMSAERDGRNTVGCVDNQIDPLLSQQKIIPYRNCLPNDCFNVGESSFLQTSISDPSLRKALLCDLNERVSHRTNILHNKQNYSSLLKEGNSPMDKKLEYYGLCDNEQTIKAHELSEVVKKHNDHGMPDDIPMEIVELMAKNQYERRLYEAEKNYCPTEKFNGKSTAELIAFPKVHGSGEMRLLDKEFLGMNKFPLGFSRNGAITPVENGGATKSHLVNFSHINRNHLSMGQLEGNAAFAMFSGFPQIQQKQTGGVQFSPSSSFRNGSAQNCEWNGVKLSHRPSLTTMPILEAYNPCHSGPRKNEEAGQFWSPVTPNHMPFSFNLSQNLPPQSNNTERHPQCADALHKGKIIRDFDLNASNLNASGGEMPNENFEFDSFKRTTAEYPCMSKERGTELNPVAVGSLDPSSNETIPAMQLLSLMDARMPSNAPFSLDTKRFLDKPFSPCDYHPKSSIDGKRSFLEKSLFPNHHHSRGFSGAGPKRSDPRPSSSVYVARNTQSENVCKCSPTDPAIAPLAMLPPINQVLKGATGFTGDLSLRSQVQQRRNETYSSAQNRGRKLQKSLSSGGCSSKVRDYNPRADKQKGILGSSDSMIFPLQSNGHETSAKHIGHQVHGMHGTVSPRKNISKNQICRLNQNPAEFTVPQMGNVYTIGREMLLGNIPPKKRPALANVDARRRQRNSKLATIKEHGNHRK